MHINTQLYLHLGRYNLTSSSAVVDVLVAVVVVVGVAAGVVVIVGRGLDGWVCRCGGVGGTILWW